MTPEDGSGSEVADGSELALRAELLAGLDSAVDRLLATAASVSEDVLRRSPVQTVPPSSGSSSKPRALA